ncbi:hypothetical protein PHYSODRAFT_396282, partial [Phytophthora sojae]
MVRLTCAKLSDRNVVCVDIGESETVAALKDAIHVKNEDFECLARDLRLFLTKRKDSLLSGRGLAAVKLDQQGNPIGFEQMKASLWINEAEYFGN